MAALPIGLIKGHRNVKHERMLITDRRTETRARVEAIRNKVQLILLLYLTKVWILLCHKL